MRRLDSEEKARIDGSDGWPVTMVTERDSDGVRYSVIAGSVDSGDHGKAFTIWSEDVRFGKTKAARAGGLLFRIAAREQAAVSQAVVDYLKKQGRHD